MKWAPGPVWRMNDVMSRKAAELEARGRQALAAQCLVALGRMQEAKRMMVEAIRDFEAGLHTMKAEQVAIPESWREYR